MAVAGELRAVLVEGSRAQLLSSVVEIDRATRSAASHGSSPRPLEAAASSSPADLIAAVRPDFVFLYAPDDDLATLCTAAIAAGSHILVASPAKIEPKVSSNLLRQAVSAKVQIGVCDADGVRLRQVRALIAAGRIGQPLLFNMSAFVTAPATRPTDVHSETVLRYALQQISTLLGTEVEAATSTGDRTNSSVACILRLASGIEGALHVAGNCSVATGERLEIYGTQGMITLTRGAGKSETTQRHVVSAHVDVRELLANPTDPDKLKRWFQPVDMGDDPPTPAMDFVASVQAGQSFAPNLVQTLRVQRAADIILATVGASNWVNIDYRDLEARVGVHG